MTDLTRKVASDPVQWTEPCQLAFERVKQALCGEPFLHTPNFSPADRRFEQVTGGCLSRCRGLTLPISRKLMGRGRVGSHGLNRAKGIRGGERGWSAPAGDIEEENAPESRSR